MMRALLTLLTLASAFFFPWQLTALLAALTGIAEPLVPLAVGISLDALYYTSSVGIPWGTLVGLLGTAGLFFVRSRLSGIIR